MESEDESDSDPDYDVKQKSKANMKKHSKKNEYEELKEKCYCAIISDLPIGDRRKGETQENFQNLK